MEICSGITDVRAHSVEFESSDEYQTGGEYGDYAHCFDVVTLGNEISSIRNNASLDKYGVAWQDISELGASNCKYQDSFYWPHESGLLDAEELLCGFNGLCSRPSRGIDTVCDAIDSSRKKVPLRLSSRHSSESERTRVSEKDTYKNSTVQYCSPITCRSTLVAVEGDSCPIRCGSEHTRDPDPVRVDKAVAFGRLEVALPKIEEHKNVRWKRKIVVLVDNQIYIYGYSITGVRSDPFCIITLTPNDTIRLEEADFKQSAMKIVITVESAIHSFPNYFNEPLGEFELPHLAPVQACIPKLMLRFTPRKRKSRLSSILDVVSSILGFGRSCHKIRYARQEQNWLMWYKNIMYATDFDHNTHPQFSLKH